MPAPDAKSLDHPEEARFFLHHGSVAIATLDSGTVGCVTCEPGWRWSTDVGALSGASLCRVNHLGYDLHNLRRIDQIVVSRPTRR